MRVPDPLPESLSVGYPSGTWCRIGTASRRVLDGYLTGSASGSGSGSVVGTVPVVISKSYIYYHSLSFFTLQSAVQIYRSFNMNGCGYLTS